MSRLDELIKELCPNGVEYKELGEVLVSLNTGLNPRKFFRLNTEDATNYYVTIREIQKNRIQFSDKTDRINQEALILCNKRANLEKGDILFSGTGTIGEVAIVDETPNNWSIKEGVYSLKPISTSINSKFLMYILQTKNIKEKYFQKVVGGTVKSITMADLKKVDIPIPPLEVQKEIVRILDNYTKSVEELKEKLNAELIARKKQYSWYRDYLLKFENKVKIVKLGELFEFKNGINKEKSSFGKGTPIINYVNVYKKNKIYFEDLQGLVEATDDELIRYKVKRGDVFFTRTSETIEEIGFTSVLLEDIENCVFSGFLLRARPLTDLLLPEYCAYCFSTSSIRNAIIRKSTYTTRALINGTSLSQIEIPLPPLEVQKRIVEVLDNFEKICNDLNIGLPAEIEARQKEYEFYRNFLLTFNNEEIYALSKQASKQASPKSN